MKKILFVTGTRADFGKLKPLMRRVEDAEQFECHVFVTGMHTLARFGSTITEVRKAGFSNVFPFFNQMATTSSAMDMVLAATIEGLGHYVREFPPDMIVVHGDRVETLAGAIVGALNNVFVGHIEGGEVSGTVDELIRHAVSKLAHFHFAANDEARQRLIQMGEGPNSIFVVGSPEIDVMLSPDLPSLAEAKAWYEIDFDEYLLFAYHPVTTELDSLRRHAREVVAAILASGRNVVGVHPNNDIGAHIIMEELGKFNTNPRIRLFPSLRFEFFLTLLKHAVAMVGNSSTGVREAPVYGVPSVNIGSRQRNRVSHESIINVPEDREAIRVAIARLPQRFPPKLHFGMGNSAEGFMHVLQSPKTWLSDRQKQFRDVHMAHQAD